MLNNSNEKLFLFFFSHKKECASNKCQMLHLFEVIKATVVHICDSNNPAPVKFHVQNIIQKYGVTAYNWRY